LILLRNLLRGLLTFSSFSTGRTTGKLKLWYKITLATSPDGINTTPRYENWQADGYFEVCPSYGQLFRTKDRPIDLSVFTIVLG